MGRAGVLSRLQQEAWVCDITRPALLVRCHLRFVLFWGALMIAASVSGRAAGESERSGIVFLVDRTTQDVVSDESFRLALTVQLEPYEITTTNESWTPPPELTAQRALAMQHGARAGARAVVWYSMISRPVDGHIEILIHLVEARDGRWRYEQIDIGPPGQAIERSMAAAVRTFLQQDRSQTEPQPTHPEQSEPVDAPGDHDSRAVWARIALGYGLAVLPMGLDVRHGPELAIGVMGARHVALLGGISISYAGRIEGQDEEAMWSRRFLSINALLAWVWHLTERIEVHAGLQFGVSVVMAEAQSLVDTSETERDILWELPLGVAGGLSFNIAGPLWVELGSAIEWLAVEQELFVLGRSVARPGNLLISVTSRLYLRF